MFTSFYVTHSLDTHNWQSISLRTKKRQILQVPGRLVELKASHPFYLVILGESSSTQGGSLSPPSRVSELDLLWSIKQKGENCMPILRPALKRTAYFRSFSLAPLSPPWEGQGQASLLEDEKHVE